MIALGTDVDIVEICGNDAVVAVDHIVGDVDIIFFAPQQHLAPMFVTILLEVRIEPVDRDRGAIGRLELERRRRAQPLAIVRSEEHTSELQSLMRISYAVFCLKKKKTPIIK